uniref:Ion transport domain-containing protein n=1 Tax=Astyanax mexicanus TaxID=7994 RepID=A0A3B1IM52_ASTMX
VFYVGKVVLCIDFIIFCLRLMAIFTISRTLGPKIIIVRRMVNDGSVLLLMFLLSIWVVAYGVAKQGILIQNEERFNWIVRGAVYEPLPHHIRELTSYLPRMANNNHAVYTFTEVQDNTDAIWKFQRYELIKEYHSRPSLPPPFILLSHIYLLITHVFLRRPSQKHKQFRTWVSPCFPSNEEAGGSA